MNKKLFFGLALLIALAAVVSFRPPEVLEKALAATDVVSIYAKSSFAKLLTLLPEKPAASPDEGNWSFSAPDGSAEMSWAAAEGRVGDVGMVMSAAAAPFMAAGLDSSRLPEGILMDKNLVFAMKNRTGGGDAQAPAAGPADSFARLLDDNRDQLAYHFQLGHYGVDLGGGNLLEWAGDPEGNKLDLVFVLDPAVLLAAGVDKERVEGWVFGSVIVHDPSGRKVEVPKFLKPFNLR